MEYCIDSSTWSSLSTSTASGLILRSGKFTYGVSCRRVGLSCGGWRRGLSTLPPGRSSGSDRQKLRPARISCAALSTSAGVIRFRRPSWSSGPKSPQFEPGGRCFQRCMPFTP
ncbi:Uncharacterised protein [Bordetella pertussis]|nr:Uncharacterised protein [Bordetella pertussis]